MSVIRDIVGAALWQGNDPFADFDKSVGTAVRSDTTTEPAEFDPVVLEALNGELPRIVVDVGAGDGGTTMQMARLFHERHHNGVVIAVDTWLGSWEHWHARDGLTQLHLESGRPTLQMAFMERVHAAGLRGYVVPLPLDDYNAFILLDRKRLLAEFLHLNLGMVRTSVERQLKLWWPLLRGGGLLFANGHQRRNHHSYLQTRETFKIFAREQGAAFDGGDSFMRIDKPADTSLTAHSQAHLLTKTPEVSQTLDYEGEFCPELVLFWPYVTWLSAAGLLHDTRVVIYAGMRCYYSHLQCGDVVEKHSLRRYVKEEQRLACLPVKSELTYDVSHLSPFHVFSDLRQRFGQLPIASAFDRLSKPLLIVHNKFAIEWNRQPINHIGLELLDSLFHRLTRDFTVVYIRHGMTPEPSGYSKDDNFSLPFDERPVLNAHPEVLCFDDVYADYLKNGGTQDLNTFKNVLYGRCHHFISSQGGGASHMAFFSGSLLMVLHRYGREERLAYGNGFYGFVANPAPIRVICLNDDEFLRGVRLFQGSWVMDGRVMIPQDLNPLLDELSPWTLERRRNGKWSR